MKIGITGSGYPIKRNILGKVKNVEYILLKNNNNLFHTLSTLKKLISGKKLNFEGKYYYYRKPAIDVLHLYNEVNYSSQKWVASCETLLPRFDETKNDHQKKEPEHFKNKKTEKALKQISTKNCLGIICISQAAADIQLALLKNYPGLENSIKQKLAVIHPSQPVLMKDLNRFDAITGSLHLIFVGTQFHLKGGVEMVEVLTALQPEFDFKLTIVSTFKSDNYVTKTSEIEADQYKSTLQNLDWITIFENIPNEKVLNLIQSAHIGILPTWSDTYGFSVLEMQAAGVPVISTDVRALPEINNDQCGWMIHLPQNKLKQALYFTELQRKQLKKTLKEQLEKILINIFENQDQLLEKSINSVKRIKKYHDPETFEKKLTEIYSK